MQTHTAMDQSPEHTHLRSPFEYRNKQGQLQRYSLEQVLKKDRLQTQEQCDYVGREINTAIEREIGAHYSLAREIAILKNYLIWMDDGQPEGNASQEAFRALKDVMLAARAKYKPMQAQLKKLRASLPPQAALEASLAPAQAPKEENAPATKPGPKAKASSA